MYEYRLALQFWGSLFALSVLAPVVTAFVRRLIQTAREIHEDSTPLSSVPSHPRPG